jgi:hypothetical protein
VGQLGHGYKFFMLSVENTTRMLSLEREANAHGDMVFVKASDIWWQRGDWNREDEATNTWAKEARGGDLLRFAFEWALNHAHAHYIVKSDIDGFVCPYHLQCTLEGLSRQKLFYAFFHFDDVVKTLTHTEAKRLAMNGQQRLGLESVCRADQDFQVYTRDLLRDGLLFFNTTSAWLRNENWAYGNWGRYLRFAWAQNNAIVFDDSESIIGPRPFRKRPRKNSGVFAILKRIQHRRKDPIFREFCSRYVFGHLIEKDWRPMYDLYHMSNERLANLPCAAYQLQSNRTLRSPGCFANAWKATCSAIDEC